MSREMILLSKEKYDRPLEEHRKIEENIITSETNDVSVQAGGGATVDKPITEVDRLGGDNTRDDTFIYCYKTEITERQLNCTCPTYPRSIVPTQTTVII